MSAGTESTDPRRNTLLRALSATELERLVDILESVPLHLRDLLHEADAPLQHVYFPTTGVLSQVALLDDDDIVEVSTIGREGMLGLPAFLGAVTSPVRTFCQIPGHAWRMSTGQFGEYLATDGALHQLLHRYTQATFVQLARGVACNRIHTLEERMSRWLLMTRDRVDSDTFPLTQEFLAHMLGVRRATVSGGASVLHSGGIIRYSRGSITIVSRERLEQAACECYQIIRREFARLVG